VSNLIKDIPVAHRAQHFLGVSVGNCVLELAANQSAPSTFERNGCDIVCDTHPSFMAFIVRNQPVTNPDTSADGGFPALVSDQKFALNFQAHVWGYPPGYEARWMTVRPRHSAPTGPSSGTLNELRHFR
jgi:hypothetical protein